MLASSMSNANLVALHGSLRQIRQQSQTGNQRMSMNLEQQRDGDAIISAITSSKYKTEMCRLWSENKECPYNSKCHFAHGAGELRPVTRHHRYKTEKCRRFHQDGVCLFGARCVFIHRESIPARPATDSVDTTPRAWAQPIPARPGTESVDTTPRAWAQAIPTRSANDLGTWTQGDLTQAELLGITRRPGGKSPLISYETMPAQLSPKLKFDVAAESVLLRPANFASFRKL